jgi:hypothetical protein
MTLLDQYWDSCDYPVNKVDFVDLFKNVVQNHTTRILVLYMSPKTEPAYTLQITLQDTKPLIWRTVIVSSDLTLDRFHDIIQIVMGWKDYHLHQFIIGNRCFASDPESLEILNGENEGKIRLGELLTEENMQLEYEYDFGDSWLHQITLKKIETIPANHRLPITCLDGQMACPPEDVGGIPGFEHFCEVMKAPQHSEYEELKNWFGGKFKARSFDLDAVNEELNKYTNWTRPRLVPLLVE